MPRIGTGPEESPSVLLRCPSAPLRAIRPLGQPRSPPAPSVPRHHHSGRKEKKRGQGPQHLRIAPPVAGGNYLRLLRPLALHSHGLAATPAPPLAHSATGPGVLPQQTSSLPRPLAPLALRSPRSSPRRPAVGPERYHPRSRWLPNPRSTSPAPSGMDLERINTRPGQSRGFTRPPSWPG
ncbi:hypothetical protein NDU88_003521 [Pleurodeles waltl]|uniref:Uncharacterized protein n=1 Tax=Pleurodeles waltl TaxID=8319 RepID=A0AAV7SFR0_PLEWA|nr:hypothetical protein NDU88_003521 [Pleurodeles waltl]